MCHQFIKSLKQNKIMTNKIYLQIVILMIVGFFSCTKSAGIGGQATIKGQITVDNINFLGNIIDSYPAQDLDVFIIYGNNDNIHDDDAKTSYDGSFEFNYLNPGNYEIFVYSECMDCPKGQDSVVIATSTIINRKDIIDMDTIHIANFI